MSQFDISVVEKAPLKLNFIIVGAGLGGLAAAIGLTLAGHKVTILEQAAQLGEVGAGIQIPPNSSKILTTYGVKDKLESMSLQPVGIKVFKYDDGKLLSAQNLVPHAMETYGGAYLHIHRADFHKVLVERAEELGVQLVLDSRVTDIDFDSNVVTCSNGQTHTSDVIIGADGLKSRIRSLLLGREDPPHNTGDLAYRALIKVEEIEKYPELKFIIQEPNINFWWGPSCHIVAYLLQGGRMCNIVALSPDNLPDDINVEPAKPDELLKIYGNWDPNLVQLFKLVHSTSKWRLQNSIEMDTWVHEKANIALLGDSCHATLPYLAQGAAQAVEDSAVLTGLFSKIERRDQVHELLKTYENLRKWRTTQIVQGSTNCQKIFHLEDGEAQRERDNKLSISPPIIGCPNRWADPVFQKFLFGYDAFDEAERGWKSFVNGENVNYIVENLYKL